MTAFKLPDAIEEAVSPLFEKLPLDEAMPRLVEAGEQPSAFSAMVDDIIQTSAIQPHPPLIAGLWLYVDELDKSHRVSQSMHDATGAYWHGIMHRREGDFSNSHHWFRQASPHPAFKDVGNDYDPHSFVDEVEAAYRNQAASEALIDLQRREWLTLFVWCAQQGSESV